MTRKLPHTPNSRIRSALRQLWLRSRERAACLKANQNTCQSCGKKSSRAKGREVYVEVHHMDGVENWPELFAAVRKYLLVDPSRMIPLCKDCHQAEHETEK